MNFETADTEIEARARVEELRKAGMYVILEFNGRVWTIKWKEV